jgi:hypothetical protein
MLQMKTSRFIIASTMVFAVLISSCKKDHSENNANPTTPIAVRLTDAPTTNFSAVNIDIKSVEVIMNTGNTVPLNVNPGIYNLLYFTNGKDTLIASATIPTAMVSQIRLILGDNNTVVVDSVTYPLKTPSGQQSGLKLNLNTRLVEGVVYIILLDFDAGKSVVREGNGNYLLKPVIRVANNPISGSIHGQVVTPAALPVSVIAVIHSDTLSTLTAADGQFLIRGALPGIYTLTLTPDSLFPSKTIGNVSVTTGHVTETGAISF